VANTAFETIDVGVAKSVCLPIVSLLVIALHSLSVDEMGVVGVA